MNEKYQIRLAESASDAALLRVLFNEVFYPEKVGILAETMFFHLPRMQMENWFIAEEKVTTTIAAAFALIPWTWMLEGISLKVAEMGIVGTLAAHQGRGLQRALNEEFDQTLLAEEHDLAVIQGIPGFYDQFGYHYAVPLENHINLPLHLIPEPAQSEDYTFRLATLTDVPILMLQDASYRQAYAIASFRNKANWRYLLTESLWTEYASEFWIMEQKDTAVAAYFRIPQDGFGEGLIVSEISERISVTALNHLFAFCKQKALQRDKPYIRLNLHHESHAGVTAVALGATKGAPYAWQIKIPQVAQFLKKIAPVLEKRLQVSSLAGLSDTFRLDFFKTQVDLVWINGKLDAVKPGVGNCEHTFAINSANFPALCLGHRTWQEIRHIKPDIYPTSALSTMIVETLFPLRNSWINEQY